MSSRYGVAGTLRSNSVPFGYFDLARYSLAFPGRNGHAVGLLVIPPTPRGRWDRGRVHQAEEHVLGDALAVDAVGDRLAEIDVSTVGCWWLQSSTVQPPSVGVLRPSSRLLAQAREIARWRRGDDVCLSRHQIGDARRILRHDLDDKSLPVRFVLLPVVGLRTRLTYSLGLHSSNMPGPVPTPDRLQLEMVVAELLARILRPDPHVLREEV